MHRVVTFFVALFNGIAAIVNVLILTLNAAFLIPFAVAFGIILIGLIPYYFWTLVTHPSWLHLYFAVVFVGVIVWLNINTDESPPPVRRGRVLTRRPDSSRRARPSTRSPRPAPTTSRIRRVR